MDLKTYLELKKISKKEFAVIVGISLVSVNNYLRGARKPTIQIGREIEKITNGLVTIDDLINHWEKKNG